MSDTTAHKPYVPNPSGLCMCGCGQKTTVSPHTDRWQGRVAGQPRCYVRGHNPTPNTKTPGPKYAVDSSTGCWEWRRRKDRKGYGRAFAPEDRVSSITGKPTREVMAHRLVYERFRGEIPEGFDLDHLCCNPACVNPDHLEPVTHAENMRRARERNRA